MSMASVFRRVRRTLREEGVGGVLRRVLARMLAAVVDLPSEAPMLSLTREHRATLPLDAPGPTDPAGPRGGLHLHWIVPPFAAGAGGHNAIFQVICQLERLGHRSTIWLHDRTARLDAAEERERIRAGFVPLDADVQVLAGAADCGRIRGDVAIATDRWTAWPLRSVRSVRLRCYFIQDFEPLFYPAGTESLLTEATYGFGFAPICSSAWLAGLMQARGLAVDRFRYGLDHAVYRPEAGSESGEPRDVPAEGGRIAFYGRASTPRRAVALGVMGLELLAERRPGLEVEVFGGGFTHQGARFRFVDHGVRSPVELAGLYRGADVGLALSATNHSLVLREMLACGLPVVDVDVESVRSEFGGEALRLAEPTPDGLAAALDGLLGSVERRRGQIAAGLAAVAGCTWEAAAQEVEKILQRLLAGPSEADQAGKTD